MFALLWEIYGIFKSHWFLVKKNNNPINFPWHAWGMNMGLFKHGKHSQSMGTGTGTAQVVTWKLQRNIMEANLCSCSICISHEISTYTLILLLLKKSATNIHKINVLKLSNTCYF